MLRVGQVPVSTGTRFDIVPGHQQIYFTEHGYQVLEDLDAEAEIASHSHVHLALSWVLRQPHVTSTLIGARTISQIDQAIQALDSIAMSD